MKLDRNEILRYMRMGRSVPDEALSARIDVLETEVLAAARPRYVARSERVSCRRVGESAEVTVGPLTFASQDLARCLRDAPRAYLFAATLGHDVDRLLRRYGATSAADLLIAQAVAATAVEQYIDEVERTLDGPRTPRFSPGYGDLPLSVQPDFLAAVDARKALGITLTDTFLMIPSKSVTAIIGVLS